MEFSLCLIHRFYGVDATRVTYGRFLAYLRQIGRVGKWESGVDPDAPRKYDTQDFVQAVLAGEIDPKQLAKQKKKRQDLTEEEKQVIAEQLRQQFTPKSVVRQIGGRIHGS